MLININSIFCNKSISLIKLIKQKYTEFYKTHFINKIEENEKFIIRRCYFNNSLVIVSYYKLNFSKCSSR